MKKRSATAILRAVLYALVMRELKNRFGRMRMGAFWTLAEPMAHILLLAFIIAYLRGRQLPGIEYPVFLLTGIVPFFLFRNVALRLMGSVDANQSLFAYKQIKPFDTFVARMFVEAILYSVIYFLLIFALGWAGYEISIYRPVEWIFMLVLGLFFSLGLGILLAIVVDAIPQLRLVIRLAFMPLYFMCGIMFPPSYLPHSWMPVLLLNPYLHVLELIRSSAIQYYRPVDGTSFSFALSVTIALLFVSGLLYRLRRHALVAL